MDKNAIKKYAVWARRELISRVSQKAQQFGITEKNIVDAAADSVNDYLLSSEEKKQRQALIARIKQKGYEQVMEEVAYTWFNRFIALRFMEVNGYLPTRVRVFTDERNNFKPQILAEAIHLELDGLNMDKVYALKEANNDEALYKYLLITQCNALSAILPGMFQRIDDYTELLFPDNLLREGSALEQMITLIPEADWQDQVQIIGWLYQYYNTEPKDKVFADLKKNIKISKENIPAATQLFTPDWIVRYMVENSLGRLWLEHLSAEGEIMHPIDSPKHNPQNPNSYLCADRKIADLKSNWKYYLDEAEQTEAVEWKLRIARQAFEDTKPEDIRCIDPCMGSGHILVYMFDVLMQIYESYGYTARDAVRSIVENNLYGLDIDDRAAQLAYFAVMMKARQYDSRFFSRGIQPHVYPICESNAISADLVDYFCGGDKKLKADMASLITELYDAKEYGSILNITPLDFDALYERFDALCDEISMYNQQLYDALLPLVQVAQALAQKYDVVVTNPPYMSIAGMNVRLADYIKNLYHNTKSDLSTVFMEMTLLMCKSSGFMAMINIPVWMFISSYEKLRQNLLSNNTIIGLIHPGRGIFGSDFGSTSFVIRKAHISHYLGHYRRLFDKQGDVESEKVREQFFLEGRGTSYAMQESFMLIPGLPIAYWVSNSFIKSFENTTVADFGFAGIGMRTGDNARFLRFWYEVERNNLFIGCKSADEQIQSSTKWVPYNKGGEFRRWYGNNDYVVNWFNNGEEIKENTRLVYPELGEDLGWKISNEQYYFHEGITWSGVTISKCSFRVYEEGFIFDSGANGLFLYDNSNRYYLAACLNTSITLYIMEVINPTINNGAGTIRKIPVILDEAKKPVIEKKAKENISLSKCDWDSFETSWDFQRHPLLTYRLMTGWSNAPYYGRISDAYTQWEKVALHRFSQLKANEEELNRIFIDIYGLQDELTPEVEDKDVTVRKADKKRDIRSLISYAVGCMFGRYSLNVDGLTYAGGEWDASKYSSFPADRDNVIPICDDEYFDDDIVGRFVKFIETVYGKEALEENLRFIADALGGSGQPRDVIRSYFLNDFYADHLKIYQKRPIYWLFDSGKKNGFKALIYMHRYQPDTIARMRTDYVHEQQARYRTAIADLGHRIENAATTERVKLNKQLIKLQEQAEELRIYEEKIHHLADQMIHIDLDDGVKRNYEIFGDVLAKIK